MKSKENATIGNIYRLNGRVPLLKAIPFGLQHVLAMFVSNLTPITMIGLASGLSGKELAILLHDACSAPLFQLSLDNDWDETAWSRLRSFLYYC